MGDTVVIVTPYGRAEVVRDQDGQYRSGAFHWPWMEDTDRGATPVNELVQIIQWQYQREAPS